MKPRHMLLDGGQSRIGVTKPIAHFMLDAIDFHPNIAKLLQHQILGFVAHAWALSVIDPDNAITMSGYL